MTDQFGPTPPHGPQASGPGGAGQPPAHPIVLGSVLDGRYRLLELLGRGATADVYSGIDEVLARSVAVKVFHRGITDAESVAVLQAEMQILAKLQNPHLVNIYDARFAVVPALGGGQPGGADLTYLVMELVPGGTLADRITPPGMPPPEVARIGAAIAGALAAIHQFGLIHREIKPTNILMSASDVKLSDVGIARGSAPTTPIAPAGVTDSAAYLSPEQVRDGVVGPSTDIYALGLVLLESLTGHREYPEPAAEAAYARLQRAPYVPDTLPGTWPTLLLAMTQLDPNRRPTASDVQATLAGRGAFVPAPAPTVAAPLVVPPPPPAHRDRPKASFGRIFGIVLLVLAIIAGLIFGVWTVIQNNEGNDSPSTTTPNSVVTTTEQTTEVTTERTTERTTEVTTERTTEVTTERTTERTTEVTTEVTTVPPTPPTTSLSVTA